MLFQITIRRNSLTKTPHTFYIISQESDVLDVLPQLTAYLLVGGLLQFGTRIHRVVVSGEQGFNVPRIRSVCDVGEELELSLHAAGGEDGKNFAGCFPLLELGDYIAEERGFEITVAEPGCP